MEKFSNESKYCICSPCCNCFLSIIYIFLDKKKGKFTSKSRYKFIGRHIAPVVAGLPSPAHNGGFRVRRVTKCACANTGCRTFLGPGVRRLCAADANQVGPLLLCSSVTGALTLLRHSFFYFSLCRK